MVPDPPIREAWRRLLCMVLLAALSGGCARAPQRAASPTGHEMLNAVLWQQQSAEYRALSMQSYALASARLDDALADPQWTAALEQRGDPSALSPAVVLDLDETVIDNARYEAQIVVRLGEYSRESFARWCEEGEAGAVPGARRFILDARARGVKVIFYTAREDRLRGCTERMLDAIGVGPVGSDELFLRGAGDKSELRASIASRHRIVLLVGDNLEDFVDGSKADAAARRALVAKHAARFGSRWIVLPNPVYGHWESLYYDFDYTAPRASKLERKHGALEP